MRKGGLRREKCTSAAGFVFRKSGVTGCDASGASRHLAFTLLEVLVAVALFGLAVAALLASVAPVHEALFRLSSTTREAGDMEIAKAIMESSRDRATLLAGGAGTLPDGRSLQWRAELEPTPVEMLFLVRLTMEVGGGDTPLRSDYLRFDPRWADPTAEKPRWLPHTAGAGVDTGGDAGGDAEGTTGSLEGTYNGTRERPGDGSRVAPATGGSRP